MINAAEIKVALLDRDGVINRKKPEGSYILRPDELELLPGAAEAVRLLNRTGILTIIVSNQRAIARGLLTEEGLTDIHNHLQRGLAESGARVDAIYHCPHDAGQCKCRKPETGMLDRVFKDFPAATRSNTILVGDALTDIQAGKAFGIKTILINNGQSSSEKWEAGVTPDAHSPSLLMAVKDLLAQSGETTNKRVTTPPANNDRYPLPHTPRR